MGLFRLSEKGFGLIETIVALGVSAALLGGASYLALENFKADKKEEAMYWLQQRRSEILYSIQSENGWKKIIENNGNFACLYKVKESIVSITGPVTQDSAEKCLEFQKPQALLLQVGSELLDGSNPKLGISPKGNFCYEFDPKEGNPGCPVGLQVSWQMICGDAAKCFDAQPKVDVKFHYKSAKDTQLNLSSYNITYFKDSRMQNLADVCASLGGDFSTGTCVFNNMGCDTHIVDLHPMLLGYDSNGEILCGFPQLPACASNEVITGFLPNGNRICSPKCLAQPINCEGNWGACKSGKETFYVSVPAQNGGTACSFTDGDTRSCVSPPGNECAVDYCHGRFKYRCERKADGSSIITFGPGASCSTTDDGANPCAFAGCVNNQDCVGSWGTCDTVTNKETYSILTPQAGSGAACAFNAGDTRSCGSVDCVGSWGACNTVTNLETYTVITPASGGGAACEAASGDTRSCGSTCIKCPAGWTLSAGSCVKDADQVLDTTLLLSITGSSSTLQNDGYLCSDPVGQCTTGSTFICGCTGAKSNCRMDPLMPDPYSASCPKKPTCLVGTYNSTLNKCVQICTGGPNVNCVGQWSTCNTTTKLETFVISTPQQGMGLSCGNNDGDTRFCGTCSSCPAGWTISGSKCVKDAQMWGLNCTTGTPGPEFFATWNGGSYANFSGTCENGSSSPIPYCIIEDPGNIACIWPFTDSGWCMLPTTCKALTTPTCAQGTLNTSTGKCERACGSGGGGPPIVTLNDCSCYTNDCGITASWYDSAGPMGSKGCYYEGFKDGAMCVMGGSPDTYQYAGGSCP